MKQMKMREKECAKLDGQLLMLQEQQIMIQGAAADASTTAAMASAAGALKELNKVNDIDNI